MVTIAPQITGIDPNPLVPGDTATLTGNNFHLMADSNVVTIGGVQAKVVQAVSQTSADVVMDGVATLRVIVPCVAGGNTEVQAGKEGMRGRTVKHPLQTNQRKLAVGEAWIVEEAGKVRCTELEPTGVNSRYVVAVYNIDPSPNITTEFTVSSGGTEAVANATIDSGLRTSSLPAAGGAGSVESWRSALSRPVHDGPSMIQPIRRHERLASEGGGRPGAGGQSPSTSKERGPARAILPTPITDPLQMHVTENCTEAGTLVSAKLVYHAGKVAIYEDPEVSATLDEASHARMGQYYAQIGTQFNEDIEPVVRENFADPLLRDLDQNNVVIILFTPKLSETAYVRECDQHERGGTRVSSNQGEYIYVYSPKVNGTDYAKGTPDYWYWEVRGVIAHELQHLADNAWRAANSGGDEEEWLSEGMARIAEELWARKAVYNNPPWKSEITYAASIRCDFMRQNTACNQASARRPALTLNIHFTKLYTSMSTSASMSPFLVTDDAHFYASSWSLIRYATDRYGAGESSFLRALTQTSQTGLTNLTNHARITTARLLGGWALALYTDGMPAVAENPDLNIPTWNLPNIFGGIYLEYLSERPNIRPYPIIPRPLPVGTFPATETTGVPGGGIAYFELAGNHTKPQFLQVQTGGKTPDPNLRIAIARLQ